MKRRKLLLILLTILILAGAWTVRYLSLNRFYTQMDNTTETIYSLGEEIPFGNASIEYNLYADGYQIRVDSFEIVDCAAFCASMDTEICLTGRTPDKLALVTITLTNTGSTAEGVPLIEFDLFGIDEPLFMDYDILDLLNPVLQGNVGVRLAENTSYQFVLPYDLCQTDFSAETWRNIDRYELFLQITTPPTCKIVQLFTAAAGR